MNAIIGDDGIITNSQIASIESKFVGYKEELEENIVSKAEGDKERINLLNENVKTYIPSLEENDVGKFAVIEGELYYLGDDELSKKAAQNQKMEVVDSGAETESNVASRIEEKAIESMVKRGKDEFKYTDGNGRQQLGGIKLVEKKLNNSTSWKIVTETGGDGKIIKIYDEGYYYIKKGITIDGIGKTDYGYIMNYDSNDVIQYKEGTHKYFSYEDSVAVSDNLLFNADPGAIDSYFSDKKNFKKEDLGKGIGFYGYGNNSNEPNFDEAFTPTSFKFDGENDYITIDSNNETDRNNIRKNGLTFEFYGKLFDDGKGVDKNNQDYVSEDGFSGMFCYWDGNEKNQGKVRFGFTRPSHYLTWSFLIDFDFRKDDPSTYYGPNSIMKSSPWNQVTGDNTVRIDEDIFLTVVIDPSCIENKSGKTLDDGVFNDNPCISQKVYIDNNKFLDGWMSKKNWDKFCENCLPSLNKFCLGRCSMSGDGNWLYTHMDCYSLRFYSKALTDDEVHKNYEKTKEYHKILESQNNK